MNEAKNKEEEMSEQDLLFNDFLEGELSDEEHALFEERLESDETFKRDYEQFFNVVGGLRSMPFTFAPDDFVDQVQSRIRSRSRGRFFADNYLLTSRIPYEVVGLVMILVMISAYFMMGVPHDAHIQDLNNLPKLQTPNQKF